MAMIEEEVGTVLLRADRVVLSHLVQGDRLQLHLVSARGAIVLADRTAHLERRLLRHLLAGLEDVRRHLGLKGDRLQIARAVPDDQKHQFPLFALVVQPAPDPDVAAVVGANRSDGCRLHTRAPERGGNYRGHGRTRSRNGPGGRPEDV